MSKRLSRGSAPTAKICYGNTIIIIQGKQKSYTHHDTSKSIHVLQNGREINSIN